MTKEKKDLIILIIGKVLQVIIALASIKILTVLLSTQEVGNYYLLLTILTLFNFAFLNPLGQYYGRHIISWEKTNNIKNATVVVIAIRIIAILLAVIISYFIYDYFKYDKYYTLLEFLIFIFIALFSGTYLVLLSVVNILGDRIKFIKFMIYYLVLALFLSILFINLFEKSAINWLYGIAISQLILIIPLYKYLIENNTLSLEKIKSKLNSDYIKKILYFIFPVTITLFLQWGQNTSYRFIIESKYSIESLAFIAVGFSVSGAIFNAVDSLANQYLNPIYIRKISTTSKETRTEAWNELSNILIPIYIILTIFIIVLSPYLVNILVAHKFQDAYIYTMFGACIEFIRVTTNLIYKVSQSEVKTNTTIIPYTVGFIIMILSMYMFDFTGKLWMIPVILILSYSIIMCILYFYMKKLLDISIKYINIFKALLLSIPFFSIYFANIEVSLYLSLLLIFIFGIYYLYAIYILFKINNKGLKN